MAAVGSIEGESMTKRYPDAPKDEAASPRTTQPRGMRQSEVDAAASRARATPATADARADLASPPRLPMHTPPPMVVSPTRLALRLACVAARPATAALVRESLALAFPGAAFATHTPGALTRGDLPAADAIVVDAWPDVAAALEVVRALRS